MASWLNKYPSKFRNHKTDKEAFDSSLSQQGRQRSMGTALPALRQGAIQVHVIEDGRVWTAILTHGHGMYHVWGGSRKHDRNDKATRREETK